MTKKTAGYVIGHIKIKDETAWTEYRSKVPATLVPWGADLVFRGKKMVVFSGEHAYTDTVVIRFPDADAVKSWFNSPEYQALIPLRMQAADVTLIGYEAG